MQIVPLLHLAAADEVIRKHIPSYVGNVSGLQGRNAASGSKPSSSRGNGGESRLERLQPKASQRGLSLRKLRQQGQHPEGRAHEAEANLAGGEHGPSSAAQFSLGVWQEGGWGVGRRLKQAADRGLRWVGGHGRALLAKVGALVGGRGLAHAGGRAP